MIIGTRENEEMKAILMKKRTILPKNNGNFRDNLFQGLDGRQKVEIGVQTIILINPARRVGVPKYQVCCRTPSDDEEI